MCVFIAPVAAPTRTKRPSEYNITIVTSSSPSILKEKKEIGGFRSLRKEESDFLEKQLDAVLLYSEPSSSSSSETPLPHGFSIIEAEPGMGRSSAIHFFQESGAERNMICVSITAAYCDEAIPYGVFRKLLLKLIGEENFRTEELQREVLQRLLKKNEIELEQYESTISQIKLILALRWSGDPAPKPNSANSNARISNISLIRRIVLSLFTSPILSSSSSSSSSLPLRFCISIDDAHHCDELSWNEIEFIINHTRNAAFLISIYSRHWESYDRKSFDGNTHNNTYTHAISGLNNGNQQQQQHMQRQPPITRHTPNSTFDINFELRMHQSIPSDAYQRLYRHQRCHRFRLRPLIMTLFDQFLKALLPNVSQDVKIAIYNTSSGIPFWIIFIARIINNGGTESFTNPVSRASKQPLVALIEFRFYQLKKELVKVILHASVIGDDFSLGMLLHLLGSDICLNEEESALKSQLQLLSNEGFIKQVFQQKEETYEFLNPLLRKTIYDLMPSMYSIVLIAPYSFQA